MDFGKHAEKTYAWVAEEDPNYVQWIRNVDTPSNRMRLFLDWYRINERGAIDRMYEEAAADAEHEAMEY